MTSSVPSPAASAKSSVEGSDQSGMVERVARLEKLAALMRDGSVAPVECLWQTYPAGQGIHSAVLADDLFALIAALFPHRAT